MRVITKVIVLFIAFSLIISAKSGNKENDVPEIRPDNDLTKYSLISESGNQYKFREITRPEITGVKLISVGKAEPYIPPVYTKKKVRQDYIQSEMYWRMVDSVNISSLLPAGANMGVKLNPQNMKFEVIPPFNLTEAAKTAINKAPSWIRPELGYILGQLSAPNQNKISAVINQAQPPYIDEVCYAIAYSTPQFLSSQYCYPQLFLENAVIMYQNDKFLNYVEITDYGIPGIDNDYYSTVRYQRSDTLGNIIQVEVPRDIYYLYIVHPKITDEIQAYVDPQSAEHDVNYANHVYNIKAPPQGVFWRNYIFNSADLKPGYSGNKYPVLKDSITLCEVLWDDGNKKRSAIWEVTKWINEVMDFDSKQERPHQPNRIYKLHLGRCGEHEDITAAAARSCLIPCRGIEAFSSDHVWNEYWDVDWQQWEPVNNSMRNKFCYSKDWGKKFGTVLCHESRGVFSSVTDKYCENVSDIIVYALDANDKPIDGAKVTLAVQGTLDETKIYIDNYGITDFEGKCLFKVESGRIYYAKMESSIGNNPTTPNQVMELTKNPEPGQCYNFKLKAAGKMPSLNCTKIESTADSATSQYKIEAEFICDRHFVNWLNSYDDLSNGYTLLEKESGIVNFFIADSVNFDSCKARMGFSAYQSQTAIQDGKFDFFTSGANPWHVIFNNGSMLKNIVNVNATIKIYELDDVRVDENNKPGQGYLITAVSPNPADKLTRIDYQVTEPGLINIDIINSSGFEVKKLSCCHKEFGNHTAYWDTTDETGCNVPSGIYFCRIKTSSNQYFARIAVIR